MALKVLDVEGARLPDAAGSTQDLIMVNGPVFQAPTADKFLGNLKMLAKTTDVGGVAGGEYGAGGGGGVEPEGGVAGRGAECGSAGETYYSVTPFRYREFVAKFSLVPVSGDLTALTGTEIEASEQADPIGETVRDEMRNVDGEWALRVQLCRDLDGSRSRIRRCCGRKM